MNISIDRTPPDRGISLQRDVCSETAGNGCVGPTSLLLEELRGQIGDYVRGFGEASDHSIYSEARDILGKSPTHLKTGELIVLFVAFVHTRAHLACGYAEVMDFSFKYLGRPLSDGTVFNSFRTMFESGLIEKANLPSSGRAGRQRELYTITSSGLGALYLAIGLSRHLSASRRRAAA